MVRIADAFNKMHQHKEAISMFEEALAISSDDPFALLGLGNLYYADHEDDRALICFERLLEGNSQNVVVMTMTGNLYRRRRQYDRAIESYKNALELEPNNSFALFGMGDCFRGHHDIEQAVFWWEKILEHEPKNQVLWTRVGDAQINLGRLDDAVESYEACLKTGEDIFAYLGLARVEHKKGDTAAAIVFCEQALKIDKKHHRVLSELATLHDAAGDFEAAKSTRGLIAS